MKEFFGPHYLASKSVSEKVGVPWSADQQDWEFEQADTKRLSSFVQSYETLVLSQQERLALMTLILASVIKSLREGVSVEDMLGRVATLLRADDEIYECMKFFWHEAFADEFPSCEARLFGIKAVGID